MPKKITKQLLIEKMDQKVKQLLTAKGIKKVNQLFSPKVNNSSRSYLMSER